VDQWRALPNPDQWQVTPETARLLQHWRSTSDTVLKSNAASAIVAQVENGVPMSGDKACRTPRRRRRETGPIETTKLPDRRHNPQQANTKGEHP